MERNIVNTITKKSTEWKTVFYAIILLVLFIFLIFFFFANDTLDSVAFFPPSFFPSLLPSFHCYYNWVFHHRCYAGLVEYYHDEEVGGCGSFNDKQEQEALYLADTTSPASMMNIESSSTVIRTSSSSSSSLLFASKGLRARKKQHPPEDTVQKHTRVVLVFFCSVVVSIVWQFSFGYDTS